MRIAYSVAAAVLICALILISRNALAQNQASQTATENFDRFLNNHPQIAAELVKNPALLKDEEFQAEHPGVKKFLETHPGVRKQVAESPGTFTYSGGKYAWNPPTAVARPGTGNYLLEHQDVARQIQSNPSLLDSKEFVDAHPGLQQFMDEHPNMRAEMKEHPYGFVTQRRRGYLPPPAPAQ